MKRYVKSDKQIYKICYMINGWRYSKSYVKSLGITDADIEKMMNGAMIDRDGDSFYILIEDEYGHDIDPSEFDNWGY